MASNQKVEENRPPDLLSPVYNLYTSVYTMYTMLVSGIISSTGLATVQNQILYMYNLQSTN